MSARWRHFLAMFSLVIAAECHGAAGPEIEVEAGGAIATLQRVLTARCPEIVDELSRRVDELAIKAAPPSFTFHVLGFKTRDACAGQDHVVEVLGELHRAARLLEAGRITRSQYDAYGREMAELLRREDERRGSARHVDREASLVKAWARQTQERLFKLPAPRQMSACTIIGNTLACE